MHAASNAPDCAALIKESMTTGENCMASNLLLNYRIYVPDPFRNKTKENPNRIKDSVRDHNSTQMIFCLKPNFLTSSKCAGFPVGDHTLNCYGTQARDHTILASTFVLLLDALHCATGYHLRYLYKQVFWVPFSSGRWVIDPCSKSQERRLLSPTSPVNDLTSIPHVCIGITRICGC